MEVKHKYNEWLALKLPILFLDLIFPPEQSRWQYKENNSFGLHPLNLLVGKYDWQVCEACLLTREMISYKYIPPDKTSTSGLTVRETHHSFSSMGSILGHGTPVEMSG